MNKPLVKLAQPWQDCLAHEQGFKPLLERAKKHDALTHAVQNAVYSLGFASIGQSLQVEWRPDRPSELVLVVPNATIGTRLQQIAPSIAKELGQYQWVIHQVRVKVKPKPLTVRSNRVNENPPEFTPAAQSAWEGLYHQLSPQSSLRQSIERLLRNRKSRR
ncbi:hypothetical protein PHIN6_01660 [Polynucleobacter sp. HIN6]|uniref:hypothetical protein n=1 Tax=Polynucleobacter sp. HIN6 TaxID=3047865 RepID=UPI002572488F|nr:hypothetical protein [Polynucleobacter sp. HIN6]BEI34648.1 hypothetical protein PHIN6_01660 [Polynucleobacter sp. HIN6]